MTTFAQPVDAWYATVDRLLNLDPRDFTVTPRGRPTMEIPGPASFTVADPTAVRLEAPGRSFRHVIGVVEGLSLVGQVSVPEAVLDRVAAFRPFMKSSVFWGAYGPRVAGDVGQAVDLLKRDPDSRQAVLTLFDSGRDLGRVEQVDLPCTVALQYTVRRGELNAWTVMRSNDAWLGLPYDLMQFGMLQAAIAQALGVPVGQQTHSAGSMHLYKRDIPKALEVRQPDRDHRQRGWLGDLWGGDGSIDETASRARRLLLGMGPLDGPTAFEAWCAEVLAR